MDHAGELGADRIYAGQMAVLGRTAEGPLIQHMWDQEKQHRAKFEQLINEYRVRPTVLTPIWNVAGFALGAGMWILPSFVNDKGIVKGIVKGCVHNFCWCFYRFLLSYFRSNRIYLKVEVWLVLVLDSSSQ